MWLEVNIQKFQSLMSTFVNDKIVILERKVTQLVKKFQNICGIQAFLLFPKIF